jgi:hypothetical protein
LNCPLYFTTRDLKSIDPAYSSEHEIITEQIKMNVGKGLSEFANALQEKGSTYGDYLIVMGNVLESKDVTGKQQTYERFLKKAELALKNHSHKWMPEAVWQHNAQIIISFDGRIRGLKFATFKDFRSYFEQDGLKTFTD